MSGKFSDQHLFFLREKMKKERHKKQSKQHICSKLTKFYTRNDIALNVQKDQCQTMMLPIGLSNAPLRSTNGQTKSGEISI